MPMQRAVLAVALFFYATASAATPWCLKWFFNVAPSGPPVADRDLTFEQYRDKLVREYEASMNAPAAPPINEVKLLKQTYNQLLDALGTDVNVATLEAMVKNKSLFDVPDQPGTNLSPLQLQMKAFRDQQLSGWNKYTLEGELIPELKARIRKMKAAE